MPELPLLVVVTGPPGSGKTTVAEALKERIGLPLLAKDAFKEVLAGPLGVTGYEASHRLGAGVYELQGHLVRELLTSGVSLIVEGNFSAETRFLHELPPARIVQLHVTAEPDTLEERYLSRTGRHPVHHDAEAAPEMRARAEAGDWDPLPLDGPLLQLDTTGDPPLEPFVEQAAAAAAAGSVI